MNPIAPGARHDERLAEGIVGPREGDAGTPRGRHLDAVQRDVEVATLERRDERLPVVLHELRPHAEAAGQAVGNLDLEPREPGARTQILEDVGLAPLHVAPPPERAAGPQPGERVLARHPGAAGGTERDAAHDRERGDEREARRGVRFTRFREQRTAATNVRPALISVLHSPRGHCWDACESVCTVMPR